jgi:cytochrome c biogenesis protein CcmG, thiol:disulfide interchange protein DsbE
MRAAIALLLAAALLSGCGASAPRTQAPTPAEAAKALAGSPPPLAALHRQASELLGGGTAAFRARLGALRGYPVVVSKWASWCGPCQYEFPFFARVAVRLGRRVAFVGLNSGDARGPARAFLARHWVPYPSYVDPHERIARTIEAPSNYPITVFFDRRGRIAYVHQGEYRDEAALAGDVARYALGS